MTVSYVMYTHMPISSTVSTEIIWDFRSCEIDILANEINTVFSTIYYSYSIFVILHISVLNSEEMDSSCGLFCFRKLTMYLSTCKRIQTFRNKEECKNVSSLIQVHSEVLHFDWFRCWHHELINTLWPQKSPVGNPARVSITPSLLLCQS